MAELPRGPAAEPPLSKDRSEESDDGMGGAATAVSIVGGNLGTGASLSRAPSGGIAGQSPSSGAAGQQSPSMAIEVAAAGAAQPLGQCVEQFYR
eukprot:4976724-Alexandrium_andersonii.AAC.1